MGNRRSKHSQSWFSKYIFIIIGVAVLIIVLGCWFGIPGWSTQPEGFWILLGAVSVGVLGITANIISIYKDTREKKETKGSRSLKSGSEQNQKVSESENVDQTMENSGVGQSQTVEKSKNVTQSMNAKNGRKRTP